MFANTSAWNEPFLNSTDVQVSRNTNWNVVTWSAEHNSSATAQVSDTQPSSDTPFNDLTHGGSKGHDPIFSSPFSLYGEFIPIALLDVLCVAGNLLLLFTICRCRQLHNISNALILNLGLTDLLVALLVLPPWAGAVFVRHRPVQADVCVAVGLLTILLFLESLSTLACIALDRYICICHPLHYPRIVTSSRAAVVITYTWAQSFVLAAVPLANFGRYQFKPSSLFICAADFSANRNFAVVLLCMTILPSCLLISVCYWRIFITARRQARRIADIHSTLSVPGPTKAPVVSARNNAIEPEPESTHSRSGSPVPRIIQIAWNRMRRTTSRTTMATSTLWLKASRTVKKTLRQNRAVRTVFTIIGCFIGCWLPYIALMIHSAVHTHDPHYVVDYVVTFLAFANSFANPVICALVNKEYRKAMLFSLGIGREERQQTLMRQVVQALTPTTAPAVRTIFMFPSSSDLNTDQESLQQQQQRIRSLYANTNVDSRA